MMTAADIRYHTPATPPEDWAETSFYLHVPQAHVVAWIYLVARPAVGAMVAEVQVSGDLAMDPLGAWYTDDQQHLVLPERLEDFALNNGLRCKAHGIRRYRLDYVGIDRTEIHIDVEDREHRLHGSPVAMHLWPPYTCTCVPNLLVRWQAGARVGYGDAQENSPLARYTGAAPARRGW